MQSFVILTQTKVCNLRSISYFNWIGGFNAKQTKTCFFLMFSHVFCCWFEKTTDRPTSSGEPMWLSASITPMSLAKRPITGTFLRRSALSASRRPVAIKNQGQTGHWWKVVLVVFGCFDGFWLFLVLVVLALLTSCLVLCCFKEAQMNYRWVWVSFTGVWNVLWWFYSWFFAPCSLFFLVSWNFMLADGCWTWFVV